MHSFPCDKEVNVSELYYECIRLSVRYGEWVFEIQLYYH